MIDINYDYEFLETLLDDAFRRAILDLRINKGAAILSEAIKNLSKSK